MNGGKKGEEKKTYEPIEGQKRTLPIFAFVKFWVEEQVILSRLFWATKSIFLFQILT